MSISITPPPPPPQEQELRLSFPGSLRKSQIQGVFPMAVASAPDLSRLMEVPRAPVTPHQLHATQTLSTLTLHSYLPPWAIATHTPWASLPLGPLLPPPSCSHPASNPSLWLSSGPCCCFWATGNISSHQASLFGGKPSWLPLAKSYNPSPRSTEGQGRGCAAKERFVSLFFKQNLQRLVVPMREKEIQVFSRTAQDSQRNKRYILSWELIEAESLYREKAALRA